MGGVRRMAVVVAALLAAGALRLPLEQAWAGRWREQGLLREELADGAGAKLGQTFFAVSLGGLRTLVATFLNLRVMAFYEDRNWDGVAETYGLMVALAPRTAEYWLAGAHHQAMNAASYYKNDRSLELSAPERQLRWRESVLRGREFAERGARQIPESGELLRFLGLLLTDRHRLAAFDDVEAAFEEAARVFGAAADLPDSLPFLRRQQSYALARIPARRAEARALVAELYADPANRTKLMRQLAFVLGAGGMDDPDRRMDWALRVFGDEKTAHSDLADYWRRSNEGFPQDGVALTLVQLEARLGIPPESGALRKMATGETTDSGSGGE